MGFAEQLLLSELAGSGMFVGIIVSIAYVFYVHLRSTIDALQEEKKEQLLKIADLSNQLVGLNNRIEIFANNMNNYVQNTDDLQSEVVRAHQEFSRETSRVLDEMIRVQNQTRDIYGQLKEICSKININIPEDEGVSK